MTWDVSRLQVDLGGVAVKTEVGLRGGEADQHGRVDLGRQDGLVEDPDHVEPHASEPDALAREDVVDAQALGGGGAEDGHGLVLVAAVQILAPGPRSSPLLPVSPRLAASTERALVSTEGMNGLLKTLALLSAPTYWTSVTGPMRPIMPGRVDRAAQRSGRKASGRW